MEEADFLIVNRIDQLAPAEVDELVALLEASQPGVPVLRMSARTEKGWTACWTCSRKRGIPTTHPGSGLRYLRRRRSGTGLAEQPRGDRRAVPFQLDELLLAIVAAMKEALGLA